MPDILAYAIVRSRWRGAVPPSVLDQMASHTEKFSRPLFPPSLRWRFVALFGGMLAAFLAVLWGLRVAEARQLAAQRQELRQEDARQLARWLEIADRPMQELLFDLAGEPQTRAMLARPDPAWLRAHLNATLSDRQFDAVWLLRADGQLVHLALRDPTLPLPPTPVARALEAASQREQRLNYFTLEGSSLWQLRAAPLAVGGEIAGWAVVARVWDDPWLRQLSRLTDAEARLVAPAPDGNDGERLEVRRPLADLHGQIVRELAVARAWPGADLADAGRWQIVLLFVAFGLLLLVALGLAVRRWVLRPLGLIGASLHQKDPAPIRPLLHRGDEFTHVARLVESAFADRAALQAEIAERQRTEAALRATEENLRHSIELRSRLARDLHDHVIQSIYAAGLGLESVRGQMSADPFGAEGRLRHCMTNLNETIRQVRSYINDLEPDPPVQRQKFADAVRALTDTMHELWPVDFEVALDDALAASLTNVVELHALQIVRESVSNALRHGRATRVKIRLFAAGRDALVLEVQDNGRGFDPVQKMGTGRGLVNLATRAREMGATLRIDSSEGAGATVRLRLPGRESEA